MINIKEHRIGNLVMGKWEDYDTGKEVKGLCRITSLCENGSLGEDWTVMVESLHSAERECYDEFEPIPLSEEWLKRMGFEKGFAGYRIKGIKKMGRWITRKKFTEQESLSIPFLRFDGLVDIYSVHQLQNLVHSLTGEELTLKQEG